LFSLNPAPGVSFALPGLIIRLKRETRAAQYAPESLVIRYRNTRLACNTVLVPMHSATADALMHLHNGSDI
jgi:hypothetical protein